MSSDPGLQPPKPSQPPQSSKKAGVKDLVGELLANRYRIEAKLGEGAMGAVYRARHVKVGRSFAVKVLHPHLLEDEKIALRFDREAELAGRLRHPNVIGVVDVGETPEGLRYMVMDYAKGSDLAGLLSEAPMPPERIIPLVRQMLDGLHHAHEAGLIHRDFKPENVLVERDDLGREIPRIVDFGISILREGGSTSSSTGRLTTNGLVLGTPHYMAPEQAVADPIDHRIDLFAMGIVIYEMLSGRLPFDGAGAEVARANLLLDPPPISKRVPFLEVDPLLEALSRRLMAKSRDQRPPTARVTRELLDLIERDRAAAAAALGVSVAASTRGPKLTERVPSEPQLPQHVPPQEYPQRHMANSTPTEPASPLARPSQPHLRPSSEPAMPGDVPQHAFGGGPSTPADTPVPRDTDPSAPPFAPPYVPSAQRTAAPQTTAMTDPLPWIDSRRAKRRLIIGVAAGLAGVGAIAVIILAGSVGSDAPKQQPERTKIAMTATPIQEPAPAPAPPTPAAGSAAAPAIAVPAPETVAAKPQPKLTPIKPGTTKAPTRTAAITPNKAGSGSAKTPVDTGPITPEEANRRLMVEYQQVNSEINALEKAQGASATQDLWQLYRHISYNAAIQNEAKRRTLTSNLASIRTELAKRKKR